MESRLRLFLLSALCIVSLLSATAQAADAVSAQTAEQANEQQVIQPKLDRRIVGIDEIDSEDFEITAFGGLFSTSEFGANAVIGARVAYHVTEGVFFEASYGRSTIGETSWEPFIGVQPPITDADRILSYYNASIGYNLLPGETFVTGSWAFKSALYLVGGVGSTNFAGDDRFTVNFGAGYRFLATDWMAIHLDMRDHVFSVDLFDEQKTTHNLEMTGGISLFF